MPKYLLLKHYRGGPEPHRRVPPMDQWAPEDVEAHVAFMRTSSPLSSGAPRARRFSSRRRRTPARVTPLRPSAAACR